MQYVSMTHIDFYLGWDNMQAVSQTMAITIDNTYRLKNIAIILLALNNVSIRFIGQFIALIARVVKNYIQLYVTCQYIVTVNINVKLYCKTSGIALKCN